MLIIGCDYHPGFQQIAFVDTESGECRRTAAELTAKKRSSFTGELKQRNLAVRVGMEVQWALALVRALAARAGV